MKKSSLIRFEESNIELFGEAAHDNTAGEHVDEEADESTIEEIVIDSIVDKIAGGEAVQDSTAREIVDILDKIARDEAIHDNIPEEDGEEPPGAAEVVVCSR